MKRLACTVCACLSLVAAAAAVLPAAASATCTKAQVYWDWANTNSYNSPTEIKGTDGCASPWTNYLTTGVNMTGWVYYSGGQHYAGSTYCYSDNFVCDQMWNKYGWVWNGYQFHIQETSNVNVSGYMYW